MSDDQTPRDNATLSADQQAVAEYFASEAYARRRSTEDPIDLLEHPYIGFGDSESVSFFMGIAGLAALLAGFAVAMPVAMEALEPVFTTRPNFIIMTIVFHTIVIPPIIAFSFATVTPMFWYGSVLLRFLVGVLMVVPGCFAWVGMMTVIEDGAPPDDFLQGFAAVMFTQFLTAGTIALMIQSWSPWALSHARPAGRPLPPLGTRAMLELTGVAAVGFAIFLSIDVDEYMEGLLFFFAIGVSSSLAVISVLIAFLRDDHHGWRAAALAGFFAFGTAFIFAGFLAAMEFGRESILYNFVLVALVSLYGGAVNYAVMWLCVWWLRVCQWRCVNRNEERKALEA